VPGGLAPPPGPAERGAETERSGGDRTGALLRSVGLPALVAVAIGTVFVAVFLSAFGSPTPHRLPVAVVGPQAEQVRAALEQRSPGGFAVTALPDAGAAAGAVRHRDVYGALVPGSPPQLLVAGANGQGVTQTLTSALGAVTAQLGGGVPQQRDLAPLSPGDTRGLAIFYAAFGVVLGGFLFGITSYQAAPKLVLRLRVVSLVLFAVVSGLAVALIATVITDAVPAPFPVVAGLTGLLALAVASTSWMVLRLIGSAGTFVTSAGLLILGNATSTGNLPAEYLPGWMRPLADVLPPGVAVQSLRGAAYFEGDSTLEAVLVLGLWSVVPLLLVVLVDAVSRRRRG
jgi:xanthosine utilization system XapX-like protein